MLGLGGAGIGGEWDSVVTGSGGVGEPLRGLCGETIEVVWRGGVRSCRWGPEWW